MQRITDFRYWRELKDHWAQQFHSTEKGSKAWKHCEPHNIIPAELGRNFCSQCLFGFSENTHFSGRSIPNALELWNLVCFYEIIFQLFFKEWYLDLFYNIWVCRRNSSETCQHLLHGWYLIGIDWFWLFPSRFVA